MQRSHAVGARPHGRRHERGRRRVHADARDRASPTTSTSARATARRAWNVRAIWENYAGWFHHRSTTELYGVAPLCRLPPTSSQPPVRDSLIDAARSHLEGGRPVEALQLTDLVLTVEPGHPRPRAPWPPTRHGRCSSRPTTSGRPLGFAARSTSWRTSDQLRRVRLHRRRGPGHRWDERHRPRDRDRLSPSPAPR